MLTGDFFITPPRTIYDLEAALRGAAVEDAGAAIEAHFARASIDMLSVSKDDFRDAVLVAIAGDPA